MTFAAVSHAGTPPLGVAIANQIKQALPWDKSDVEVSEISVQMLDQARGYDDVHVRVPMSMASLGKVTFPVSFFKNGAETKTLWATARIKVYKKAVVALKPLKSKSTIGRADVKLARVDVRETDDSLASVDDVAGMVAERPISPGAVIKKSYIRPEVLVKRGEKVMIKVRSGMIRVRSRGTAAEDGYKGRAVTVRTASGREISGLVTGPDEITVDF